MKLAVRFLLLTAILASASFSQGVTTSAIQGQVLDKDGNPLPGANVMATHQPTGAKYGVTTREDGQYNLSNLRVGGPYTVSVSLLGFSKQGHKDIYLQLSQSLRQDFRLTPEDVQIGAVEVTAERSTILNAARTGAATAINRSAIEALPTITRKVQDFSRLTPQFAGNNTFGGMDNRYNNTTIDGSYFNNSFGLQGQPGDRTNVAPISVEAVDQIQVNVAPYDVRQGNFIGAGINSVTRSGTNEISGAAYYFFRHQGLVGQKAGDVEYKPGTFKYNQVGVRLGGPIIENQLFLFASFEDEKLTQPGTSFVANTGGQPVGGNTTRVLKSDLDNLSSFLSSKFGYETGPYQGYNNETPALRFLAKLDYNLDEKNKFTLRYIHLDSKTDVLESNSSSLGIGTGGRQNATTALGFQNSNYQIGENIRNIIGEWSTTISDNMSNNLIAGYSHHDESRDSRGSFFPFVDILNGGTNYTSFGFEPFTPNNELRYSSIQFQDNFSYYMGEHLLTFGASVEKYQSENVFFPGKQSAYVYNSLADFYASANANLTGTPDTVTLRRFQVRYSNIPGQVKPIQDLKVLYSGLYAQDEWQVTKDIRVSLGLRLDVPMFENTGYRNDSAAAMTFRDENGNAVHYKTDKLPDANILWSPRAGFNWDVTGERTTQVRGGTGIFTGKPAYVWISNQIGNNGVLTGFDQYDNTKLRPFNPDPDHYKPATVNGTPAANYELALTDPNFKFPQLWRSNIAVDQKLPFDLVGTAEFLYGRDVNGIYYINANLPKADTVFVGVDNRPRWKAGTNPDRINKNVPDAIVMKNENTGYSYSLSFSLEKPFADGWFAKAAYNYGISKNTVDPGSIASGSWYGNAMSGDPNNPGVGFAATSPGHRVFATVSYRADYFDIGATTISVFWEGRTLGYINGVASTNASYVYGGDLNGDAGTANDLIYIPKNQSEMNFKPIAATSTAPAFTAQQQADAWEAYIKQDDYLNSHRGEYAQRNAVFMPMTYRADLSIVQEVFTDLFGKRNALQFRMDILNVTNLLNKNWGLGQRLVTTTPLVSPGADANGKVTYQLAKVGASLIDHTFEKTAGIDDVYRIQFGVRYTFN
ncbi:MAG: carboxypeptidase regulatory-like domain-containing protein [Bacteroidota bacterium]|nr:carboxypeptidase regulatory-like domain-containing protein [Bacteroidota bacterium]